MGVSSRSTTTWSFSGASFAVADATTTFYSSSDAATTAAAVQRVRADNKAKILGQAPDGSTIDFQTKKTLFNWELLGRAIG